MNSCLLLSFFFICTNLKCIRYINCIILTEGVVNRTIHNILYVCMYVYKLVKWFPLQGERAQSLKVYNKRMSVFKNNIIEMRKRR